MVTNKDVSDILYAKDYEFTFFSNSGDSGELLLACNKKNPNEKYLVKHEHIDCACNEFMYSKIGNYLGIKIPDVKLFVLDKQNTVNFKSLYVCGITYLENSEKMNFSKIQEQKSNIKNWKDYFKMRSLEALFEESDDIEVLKHQNEIYRIDAVDAFTLCEVSLSILLKSNFACGLFNLIIRGNKESRFLEWELAIKNFEKNCGKENLKYFLEPFYLFLEIPSLMIENWSKILNRIYPEQVSVYYQEYFKYLKMDLQEFMNSKKEYFDSRKKNEIC